MLDPWACTRAMPSVVRARYRDYCDLTVPLDRCRVQHDVGELTALFNVGSVAYRIKKSREAAPIIVCLELDGSPACEAFAYPDDGGGAWVRVDDFLRPPVALRE